MAAAANVPASQGFLAKFGKSFVSDMCGKRITPDATHHQHCPKSTFGDRCCSLTRKKLVHGSSWFSPTQVTILPFPQQLDLKHAVFGPGCRQRRDARSLKDILMLGGCPCIFSKPLRLRSPSRQWVPRIFVRCNLDRK